MNRSNVLKNLVLVGGAGGDPGGLVPGDCCIGDRWAAPPPPRTGVVTTWPRRHRSRALVGPAFGRFFSHSGAASPARDRHAQRPTTANAINVKRKESKPVVLPPTFALLPVLEDDAVVPRTPLFTPTILARTFLPPIVNVTSVPVLAFCGNDP